MRGGGLGGERWEEVRRRRQGEREAQNVQYERYVARVYGAAVVPRADMSRL